MKKSSSLLIFILFVIGILITGCTIESKVNKSSNPSINNSSISEIEIYTDENFNFSVEYPKEMVTEVETPSEATNDHEASPDGGINFYLEDSKEDKIYVFGQHGHISIPEENYKKDEFITNDGTKGYILSGEHEGRMQVYLVLGDGFHGAIVDANLDIYNRNKEQINEILKSIRIIK